MLIAFLLALAFHASDSVQPAVVPPEIRLILEDVDFEPLPPPPAPPVFKSIFAIGGLAIGIALFLPIATAVADATRNGCEGYSCMGNGMLGVLTGMVVLATLPVLGYWAGAKLDLRLFRDPNRASLQLSIPIDAITSRRKAAVGSAYDAKTLAYASGTD